jgi:hypothetical protein
VLIVQIAAGLFNPFKTLYPWTTIRDIDKQAISMAQSTDGDVWFPVETELAIRAGKAEWDNCIAISCASWAGFDPPQRLMDAIENSRFDYIIVREKHLEYFYRLHPVILNAVSRRYSQSVANGLVVYERRAPQVLVIHPSAP